MGGSTAPQFFPILVDALEKNLRLQLLCIIPFDKLISLIEDQHCLNRNISGFFNYGKFFRGACIQFELGMLAGEKKVDRDIVPVVLFSASDD